MITSLPHNIITWGMLCAVMLLHLPLMYSSVPPTTHSTTRLPGNPILQWQNRWSPFKLWERKIYSSLIVKKEQTWFDLEPSDMPAFTYWKTVMIASNHWEAALSTCTLKYCSLRILLPHSLHFLTIPTQPSLWTMFPSFTLSSQQLCKVGWAEGISRQYSEASISRTPSVFESHLPCVGWPDVD